MHQNQTTFCRTITDLSFRCNRKYEAAKVIRLFHCRSRRIAGQDGLRMKQRVQSTVPLAIRSMEAAAGPTTATEICNLQSKPIPSSGVSITGNQLLRAWQETCMLELCRSKVIAIEIAKLVWRRRLLASATNEVSGTRELLSSHDSACFAASERQR